MASSLRRLNNELRQLRTLGEGIVATPEEDNLRQIRITLPGPPETPYAGYLLELTVTVPEEYPHSPPQVRFAKGIIHPNIGGSGRVCFNILDDDWMPNQSLGTVITSLVYLLGHPNTKSPLDGQLAHLYEKDLDAYEAQVRAACVKHLQPQ